MIRKLILGVVIAALAAGGGTAAVLTDDDWAAARAGLRPRLDAAESHGRAAWQQLSATNVNPWAFAAASYLAAVCYYRLVRGVPLRRSIPAAALRVAPAEPGEAVVGKSATASKAEARTLQRELTDMHRQILKRIADATPKLKRAEDDARAAAKSLDAAEEMYRGADAAHVAAKHSYRVVLDGLAADEAERDRVNAELVRVAHLV